MNKRSSFAFLDIFSVVLPGAIGMYVVARSLSAYWGRDWVATVIVGAMALALLYGLVELIFRLRHAAVLALEIEALPSSPSEATVDGASPVLSNLLRARLEQAPSSANLGESVAPFLSGLLVMLGLLGTLLGLFESVRGAGHALTSSADVETLRNSLSTPIEGLTRSFGCSAAGISASAMLGLAVALVRRRESRVLRAAYAYAAGPLRWLSPMRRQARAIEQLANQGSALPNASVALEKVGTQLATLSERLSSSQQEALAGQKRAFGELLGGLRSELSKLAADAGSSLHQRVAPLLQDSIAQVGETVRGQAAALSTLGSELARSLDADASARRDEAASWLGKLSERLTESERAHDEHRKAELASLHALTSKNAAEVDARTQALDARWAALIEKVDAQLASARAQEAERVAHLDALSRELGTQLGTLAQELGTQLAERREHESAHDERARTLSEQLGAGARALGDGVARQEHALQQLVERLPPLFTEAAAASQRGASEALSKLIDTTDTRLERVSATVEQVLAKSVETTDERLQRASSLVEHTLTKSVEQTDARLERASAAVEHTLTKSVEQTDARLERASAAVEQVLAKSAEHTDARLERVSKLLSDERAQRLDNEKAHDDRALAALERLEQSSGLLDQSLAAQGESVEGLVARVGGLLEQLTAAAQERAQATLDKLAHSADEQAARFAQLTSALETARADHGHALEQQVSAHAVQLEERLAKTSALVQEAAASWQASTVEMQAVADVFAKSVDRQREASDAWLESLGEVEGAVERAGKYAARDALSDQLASTQEVFARQLQFQRELFEQLRNLRTVTPRANHGEHDVSV